MMKTGMKREATRTAVPGRRADTSTGAGPLGALQRLADGSQTTQRLGAIQRMSLEEEEPLQGKAIQRAAEEEVQMRAVPTQTDTEEEPAPS
jgi:hypothetical protein